MNVETELTVQPVENEIGDGVARRKERYANNLAKLFGEPGRIHFLPFLLRVKTRKVERLEGCVYNMICPGKDLLVQN